MAADAHAHPFYLAAEYPQAETERRALRIACAASAFDTAEFLYNEALAQASGAPCMALCFALHPQLPAFENENRPGKPHNFSEQLAFLRALAGAQRIHAVGEMGFDLYDSRYKATEKEQDALFYEQLAVALQFELPVVLHVRRAWHKIFAAASQLRRLPAVVFHSFSGSFEDAGALLRKGINAFFSFGAALLANHKRALRCCALIPSGRLLFETDAPYQYVDAYQHKKEENVDATRNFSSYRDIFAVVRAAAALRNEDRTMVEQKSDAVFFNVFGLKAPVKGRQKENIVWTS